MYEQLKQLLSEATIHIEKDVNSTHISFSFEAKDVTEGPVPEGDIKAMQKAQKELEKIVEATGVPKDNVIIGSVPKAEKPKDPPKQEKKKEDKPPKALDMFPDNLPEEPRSKKMQERVKQLEALGFAEKKDQMVRAGLGLALTYLEKAEDKEFERAIGDINKHIQANKDKFSGVTQQATASASGKAEVKGDLTEAKLSDEQREIIEMEYAVPADDTQYKGKPATPEEAFEPPTPKQEKKTPPPPPDDDEDLKFVAKNPMEQIKKNNGKPYLNKKDELVSPEPKSSTNVEDKEMLWNTLMSKCNEYGISTDGIELEGQSVEDLQMLHKWVDETIEEENLQKA